MQTMQSKSDKPCEQWKPCKPRKQCQQCEQCEPCNLRENVNNSAYPWHVLRAAPFWKMDGLRPDSNCLKMHGRIASIACIACFVCTACTVRIACIACIACIVALLHCLHCLHGLHCLHLPKRFIMRSLQFIICSTGMYFIGMYFINILLELTCMLLHV